MIFPEISAETWCKNNPPLEVQEGDCESCGDKLVANIPFIETIWVGMTSEKCACGNTLSVSTLRRKGCEHSQDISKKVAALF